MTTTTNPTRKASEIGFGIEIECSIPTVHRAEFPLGQYHRGTQVNVEGFSGWTTQSDSSVSASGAYYPAEIVSPVLRGEAGLIQVVKMLDHLKSIRAKVNESCGLHVHVDVSGLTGDEMNRVVLMFKKFEVAFYDMNGRHAKKRYTNNFCKPSQNWNGTRYQSLNLQHIHEENPHIEIRVWQGAMKPETVVSAIYMAVSLVSRVTASAPIVTSDIDTRNKKDTMEKYINRFMDGETMIVPNYDPHDIWAQMMNEAIKSNRR